MLLSTNIAAKCHLVFVLMKKSIFPRGFFSTNGKALGLWSGTRDIWNNPSFTYFYATITVDFERFQFFVFESSFLRNENLGFLVMSTTVENATLP